MGKLTLTFLKPGLATTIQDNGRSGFEHMGVPVGGPLDRQSAILANKIVGNETYSAIIEATLIGPTIEFNADCLVAITGGNLTPSVNKKPCKMYCPIQIKAGDILSFVKAVSGCRSYIAIAGEWQLKKWMGSVSTTTHLPEYFTPDSVIEKGTSVIINTAEKKIETLNSSVQPKFANHVEIGILPGPEFNLFSNQQINTFLNNFHQLSNDCNRMAYRLKSIIEDFQSTKELISSGVIPGTIQITNEGQPIILLADAQTTGGYYRLANIIESELDILGQLKPGDQISFTLAKKKKA